MSPGESSFWRRTTARLGSPFRHAVRVLGSIASQSGGSEDELRRLNVAIGSLFLAMLHADGRQSPDEVARIDQLFIANFGKREARRVQESLANVSDFDVIAQCRTLAGLGREEAGELVRGMIEIGFADDGVSAEELAVVRTVAKEFGLDDAFVGQSVAEVRAERNKRSTLVRSGAGILIALLVIAIFIFTATFLKSVLFGLVLAYFFLPLQRWYQTRFFPHPWVRGGLGIIDKLLFPVRWLAGKIQAPFVGERHAPATAGEEHQVSQACHATLATLVVLAVAASFSLAWFSSSYVANVRSYVAHSGKVKERAVQSPSRKADDPAPATSPAQPTSSESSSSNSNSMAPTNDAAQTSEPSDKNAEASDTTAAEPTGGDASEADQPALAEEPLGGGIPWLERYRPDLAEIPLLRMASQMAEDYLTDPEKKKELMLLGLRNLQPILLRAGGVFTALATLLLDSMLTLFFFTFFLQKIAAGQSKKLGRQKQTGQYIVEAIFDSGWLPDISAPSLREAQIIIDDIISMLQTWVKGYLWIIIIETCVYTTLFMLLGVPYFPIFGLIAGMTILLPFIGPIVGCALTVIVTFALHSQSVTLATAIILVYFVVHGVVEQLILYPAFVGEALGLNTLETIIVVLLGGVLAGLAGVIFAVPAAAILKYLVPKIYATIAQQRADDQRHRMASAVPSQPE